MANVRQISISIVLPVYNGGLDLLISVRSIIDQTFHDWELIIVDDASEDGSLEKIYQINDSRIKIFRNQNNMGIAYSLNKGIDLAFGKYIARMDHDDICHPQRLQIQYDFLEANQDVDLVATNYAQLGGKMELELSIRAPKGHEDIVSRPWLGFAMAHPTWMGKARWFKINRYKYPAPYYAEDAELLLRTFKFSKFNNIQDNLLLYRYVKKRYYKLFKARLSHLIVQLYFYRREREILKLPFVLLLFLAHILKDSEFFNIPHSQFFRRSKLHQELLSKEEQEFWRARIKQLSIDIF